MQLLADRRLSHNLVFQGNKKFRALCFARKPEFEAGNHAAKRRIATEIVDAVFNGGEARFLRRKSEKGPWLELNKEQAILKACQVMRDYKRPDRLAIREMMAQNGQARKRSRQVESTPMLDIVSREQMCGVVWCDVTDLATRTLTDALSLLDSFLLACSHWSLGTHY